MYENLKDVKVLLTKIPMPTPAPGFGMAMIFGVMQRIAEDMEPRTWAAVYHTAYRKWIVTDDLESHGLEAEAAQLQLIGYADTLDGIMFVVWEHQRAIGHTPTVLDEIRAKRPPAARASNKEWLWAAEAAFKPTRSTPPSAFGWFLGSDGA